MLKIKKTNLTKKNISNKINQRTGFSISYTNKITDNFINILKDSIKHKEINIKNFGTFKTINKKKRIGRNPKNMKNYIISSRKSLSFVVSKKFNDKINNS